MDIRDEEHQSTHDSQVQISSVPHAVSPRPTYMDIRDEEHHSTHDSQVQISSVHHAVSPRPTFTYSNTAYSTLQPYIDSHYKSLAQNYRYPSSMWGNASEILYKSNTLAHRTYLHALSILFENSNHYSPKYKSITPLDIQNAISAIPNAVSLTTQLYSTTGLWNAVSRALLSTSTYHDKRFLSSFWQLYSQSMLIPNQTATATPTTQTTTSATEIQSRMRNPNNTSRRDYMKEYYKANAGNIERARQLNPPSLQPQHQSQQDQLIQELCNSFTASIWQFPTLPCATCDKLMYISKSQNFIVDDKTQQNIQKLGFEVSAGTKLRVCDRCYNHMKRGSLSPQVKYNNLYLLPIPTEIQSLSIAEVGLISQVKLYMKIYHLCNGRGQPALKGLAIHFPLNVNEVINQLPTQLSESDIVLVAEDFTGVERIRDFEIKPAKVYAALQWLKNHNPLYYNIEIVPVPLQDVTAICVNQMGLPYVVEEEIDCAYHCVGSDTYILRASLHQGHHMFMPNSGLQCSAMCASFIAFSFVQSPLTWTRETLDQVLLCGNNFYSQQRSTSADVYLNMDDISNTVTHVFQSLHVKLELYSDALHMLQGYLNKFHGDVPRVHEALLSFINMPYQFAVFTSSGYSMGLFKDQQFLYFFDSHSRGARGGIAQNGKACVIRYLLLEAPTKLSYLINHNIQPSKLPGNFQDPLQYAFTISPFRCTYLPDNVNTSVDLESSDEEDEQLQLEDTDSPLSKRRRLSISDHPYELDLNPVPEAPQVQPRFAALNQGGGVTDSVIAMDDFIEPPAKEIINLHRSAGKPLNSSFSESLDLLAFPHIFPHGVNGLYQSRINKISPPDYFQQRLMSADKRFNGKTDLLFYALSESDKYRVQQKIGICCLQKNQVGNEDRGENDLPPGGMDPSSYMSAIRGSAPYWKQYCGDLIAMIKQLGIPTFFLTFSFDDLNSLDSVTALWKAENGAESEPPEDLAFERRRELLNKHPIAAARHFSMRVSKFLALIQARSEDIFGNTLSDYSIRIEFQARGSPHAHCLLWLNDVPDFNTPEGIAFIDNNISCSLSTTAKDLVLKYQNHKHSSTCFRNKKLKRCRFAYPKKACENTSILPEADIHKNGGKFVDLKRQPNEAMINSYHPVLIHILKCNMDIQPVTGEMAIAFYIAKYMSKPEPAEIRAQIQASIENIMRSDLPSRQKMNRVAITLMKNREISAQEAAFRLCHLYLRKSSRVCVFVPTFLKERRLRMVRKETIGQDAQFCLNVIDRYIARPVSLESICLFEFAAQYQPYVSQQRREENVADEDVEEFREQHEEELIGNKIVLTLLNNKGKIFKRSIPAVVKHPNFDINKDMDSYYYSLLLLYLPFREESFCDNTTPIDAFKDKHASFRTHLHNPILNHELAQRIDQALLRVTEYSLDENNIMDLESDFQVDYVESEGIPLSAEEVFHHEPVNLVDQIKSTFATLSEDQKSVFLEVDRALKSGQCRDLRFVVCGEGGCGKSYLIGLLSLLIRNFYSHDSLLIAAPTGKAAFNIKGATLHRTFALPVEIGSMGTYHRLGSRKLEEMRRLYQNVMFNFIDEFSMVSYETLRNINLRMGEIFSSDMPFADKNILLFGDLMQLKPPRGSWIFKKPDRYRAEQDLWRTFKFYELKFNHRQAGLDPLLSICSRLRIGELEMSDINTLQSRLLDANNPNYLVMKDAFKNCVRVFPKLKQVAKYNKAKTEELRMSGVTIYTMVAKDTYADGLQYGQEVPAGMVYKDDGKCGGLPRVLELGIGSRVMLRQNKDVLKGLVNGAMGTIVGFEWNFGHQLMLDVTLPQALIIKFDHLQEPQRIESSTADFFGKRQKRVTRLQMPVIQADAINVHKIQGDTVDSIVLDLGKDLFAKGMAYVGISRVKTMKGLAIASLNVNKLIRSVHYCPCDTDALAELMRLRSSCSPNSHP